MGALQAKWYDGYDLEMENFLKKEFYYILQVAALLPYIRGKWFWLYVFHYVAFFFILTFTFVQLLYTTALIKDQLALAAQTFHIAGGLGVCITILLMIPYHRDVYFQMTKNVQCNFFDYGKSFDTSQVEFLFIDMNRFKTNMVRYFPVLLGLIGAQAMIFGPIEDRLQGYGTNETYINKVYMKIPIPLWFPFSVNFYFAFVYEFVMAITLLSVLGSGILSISYFTHAINVQLKILIFSIESIEKRARNRCKEIYFNFEPSKRDDLYKDSRFIKEYNFCIKQNVEHHKIILRAQQMVDLVQKWPLFNTVFFISLVIACSLFILLKGDTRISPQLFSLLLLIMEMIAIMIICLRGQELTDECNKLYLAFYRTKWIYCAPSIKQSIIVVQERVKKPLSYKAGGFTDINWELFGSIMNTAYSYFNLMLAMKDNEDVF